MSNFEQWYFLLLLRRDEQAKFLVEQYENNCVVRNIFKIAQELDLNYNEFLELLAVENIKKNNRLIEQSILRLLENG